MPYLKATEQDLEASLAGARRIPGPEEPGGLPSTGSHRVGHGCSDLAAAKCGWSCGHHHITWSLGLTGNDSDKLGQGSGHSLSFSL